MKYVLKSTLASMVLLAGSASIAHAAGAGSGTVTFEGAIIEAACSIKPESVDQTVSLGQVARSQLADGGYADPEPFYIKLVGCDTSTLKTVTTTFTGAESAAVPGALGIVGTGVFQGS
ncbi:MAG TPA: fimbria A protein, partial [Pseudomonas sp.]|uniref:fimbrial protein n=1 Tax=Pseudomonas sp. TaxID=306 RepID=UPI000ECBB533